MNEITRIHLAKTPYNIELGAKKELEKYVSEIAVSMHADDDVMREIEARMVELLAARGVTDDRVIAGDDVRSLKEQLGEPKEFADGDEAVDQPTAEVTEEKPVKRLMRDTDNAGFGGVCAGLAAYFNVDVVIFRLIFIVAIVLSAGSLLLAYLLFWIVIPPARTAADKLAMSGKSVTLESLRQSVEHESRPLKQRPIVRFGKIFLGMSALFAAAGTLVGTLVGGYMGYDAVNWMYSFEVQSWAYIILVALFVGGLALTAFFGLLAAGAFLWKISKPVGVALSVIMFIGLLVIVCLGIAMPQASATMQRDIKRLTKVEQIKLPSDLSGVTSSTVTGAMVTNEEYAEGQPVRAEISYPVFHGERKPEVKVEKLGDTLQFTVTPDAEATCPIIYRINGVCVILEPTIKTYGVAKVDIIAPAEDE